MTIQTRKVEYDINGKTYEGVLAYDDTQSGKRPGVLISHAWAGCSDFETDKAKALAELGYVGFALDLYGKGVLGETNEQCQALMTPLVEDREMLRARLATTIDVIKNQPEVDATQIGAIGFCFGGLCVLNMARGDADIKGVVSFHGLLGEPDNSKENIKAKILVLHGWDDPMVTSDNVVAFAAEMTNAKADWQIHAYGGTMHAFTNPAANDPDFGTVYDKDADRRSWTAMKNFLSEVFRE
ncbi:MAG: dienelactone hydrolase family protein [Marinicaulis sp.]|nr:dienelactone hydrolase family protein [Marinicaulis sp.]